MTSKVLIPAMMTAFLIFNAQTIRADQPNNQSAPAPSPQANTAPPASATPTQAPKATLRDKLFRWSAFFHGESPCQSCNLTDPDFCCSNCKNQWIFLFGSCREFYGDRNANQAVFGYVSYH